jgi:ketosteroid isomerase-like protein
MSEENVEVVRRFCERDDQTSLESLMASLHPDIEWIPIESDPEYSVHRGHDDVRAWLTSWGESFPDLRWELDRILDAGSDLVVAFVRLAGAALTRLVSTSKPPPTPWYSRFRARRSSGSTNTSTARRRSKPPGCRSRQIAALDEKRRFA